MEWFAIIFIAIIVEGVVEYIKLASPKFAASRWIVPVTVLIGVGVAIAYNADLLAVAGLTTPVPYIGNVLTGILISRGSNYIYDLIGKYTDAQKAEFTDTAATETEATENAEG